MGRKLGAVLVAAALLPCASARAERYTDRMVPVSEEIDARLEALGTPTDRPGKKARKTYLKVQAALRKPTTTLAADIKSAARASKALLALAPGDGVLDGLLENAADGFLADLAADVDAIGALIDSAPEWYHTSPLGLRALAALDATSALLAGPPPADAVAGFALARSAESALRAARKLVDVYLWKSEGKPLMDGEFFRATVDGVEFRAVRASKSPNAAGGGRFEFAASAAARRDYFTFFLWATPVVGPEIPIEYDLLGPAVLWYTVAEDGGSAQYSGLGSATFTEADADTRVFAGTFYVDTATGPITGEFRFKATK